MRIIKHLCDSLYMSEDDLTSFALTSPHRYKVYDIPKKNSNGFRTIAHPSKELKYIQRLITAVLSDKLPIHECAFAYQKGIGIKDNARRHSSSKYLLKMDFENFFPSITPKLFFQMAESKGLEFDEKDRLILSCFLFWKKNSNSHLVLSIGAPSSPLVSNFVMSGFDEKILGECEKRKVTYTRYADDITFSTKVKDVLFSIPSVVEQNLIETVGKGIKVNMAKTVFTSKAHNRHVTGVTITNDGGLSVGRERKRLISSKIHKFSLNLLPQTEVGNLHGLLSHAAHIEPDFYIRMRNKYGTDVIDRIKRA